MGRGCSVGRGDVGRGDGGGEGLFVSLRVAEESFTESAVPG